MKTYCVIYEVTMNYEAIFKAKSKEEAIKTVVEVIGDPITVTDVTELQYKRK